jgi:hypothetical protein
VLDVADVLLKMRIPKYRLDGSTDALGHVVSEIVFLGDDRDDAVVINGNGAARGLWMPVYLQAKRGEVGVLVSNDEAWAVYAVAAHEATYEIAEELLDDDIVMPHNFAILDGYLTLLQVW